MLSEKVINAFINSKILSVKDREKKYIYDGMDRLINTGNPKIGKLNSKQFVIFGSSIYHRRDVELDLCIDFYSKEILNSVLLYEKSNDVNNSMIWYLTDKICGEDYFCSEESDLSNINLFRNSMLYEIKNNGPDKVDYCTLYANKVKESMKNLVI